MCKKIGVFVLKHGRFNDIDYIRKDGKIAVVAINKPDGVDYKSVVADIIEQCYPDYNDDDLFHPMAVTQSDVIIIKSE